MCTDQWGTAEGRRSRADPHPDIRSRPCLRVCSSCSPVASPWGGVVPVLLRRGDLDEVGHRVMVGETGPGDLSKDLSQAFHGVSGWMSRVGTLGVSSRRAEWRQTSLAGSKPCGCTWPGDLFDPHPPGRRWHASAGPNPTCQLTRPLVSEMAVSSRVRTAPSRGVRQGAGRSASMTVCRTTRAGLDADLGCRSLGHCLLMAWSCSLGCSRSNTSSSLTGLPQMMSTRSGDSGR